jgi:hypothetical protein
MDLSGVVAPSPLPFHPVPAPPPSHPTAPSGPLFPEVARPAAPLLSSPPEVAAPTAMNLLTLDGEPPKTLGAFFLAAMARAGRAGAPLAAP